MSAEREKLVIFGAGGFGKEVAWQITSSARLNEQYEIIGYLDNNEALLSHEINGYPVLGDENWLKTNQDELNIIIAVGSVKKRKKIYGTISGYKNIKFPTIIADGVLHSDTVTFGRGCFICFYNVLTCNITIGDFVILSLDCTVGHDAKIDNFVTVYPSVTISGNTHLKEGVEIGTCSAIIQGKTVGENTIIGAGAVVVKDLPSDCTAVGIPAKPIKFHNQ